SAPAFREYRLRVSRRSPLVLQIAPPLFALNARPCGGEGRPSPPVRAYWPTTRLRWLSTSPRSASRRCRNARRGSGIEATSLPLLPKVHHDNQDMRIRMAYPAVPLPEDVHYRHVATQS